MVLETILMVILLRFGTKVPKKELLVYCLYRFVSVCISLYQFVSVCISLYWFVLVCISLYILVGAALFALFLSLIMYFTGCHSATFFDAFVSTSAIFIHQILITAVFEKCLAIEATKSTVMFVVDFSRITGWHLTNMAEVFQ